jgi:hypothetical protein
MRREREKSKERETGREVFVMGHDGWFFVVVLLFLFYVFYYSTAVYEAGRAPTLSFASSVYLKNRQASLRTRPRLPSASVACRRLMCSRASSNRR